VIARDFKSQWLVLRVFFCFSVLCRSLYDPVHHLESARVYGNIDAFAYYFIDLSVGTPPQRVSVIIDTGSAVAAFPCANCAHCGRHIDPAFDFARSSTARWVSCGGDCSGSCSNGHCSYRQGYLEGSSISGFWFRDWVHLGDSIQHNPSVNLNMGCHQDENKLFYTQRANGILGLGPRSNGRRTLLQEMFQDHAHINTMIFSLCLSEWGGRLVVGGSNSSYHTGPVVYTSLALNTGYYGVSLTSMSLGGNLIGNRFGRTFIDSGTTYTYMASAPYRALKSAIENHCRSHNNCGATHSGNCWSIPDAHAGLGRFPHVDVVFNGVNTVWVPAGYLFRKGMTNQFCYAFENDGAGAGTTLGASWMQHKDIIFDLASNRVGIVPANCPQYRDRPALGSWDEPTLAPTTSKTTWTTTSTMRSTSTPTSSASKTSTLDAGSGGGALHQHNSSVIGQGTITQPPELSQALRPSSAPPASTSHPPASSPQTLSAEEQQGVVTWRRLGGPMFWFVSVIFMLTLVGLVLCCLRRVWRSSNPHVRLREEDQASMPPEIVGSTMVAPENTFIIGDDDDDDVEDQIIGEEELGLVFSSDFQNAEAARDREMLAPGSRLTDSRSLAPASREVREAFHAHDSFDDARSPSPEWDRVSSLDVAGMPIFSGMVLANGGESGGDS